MSTRRLHFSSRPCKVHDYETPTPGRPITTSGYTVYNPESGVELGYERTINEIKPTLGEPVEGKEDTDGYTEIESDRNGYKTLKGNNTRYKHTIESNINPGIDDKEHVYDEIPANMVIL